MARYIDADLLQEKLDKTFLGNRPRDVLGFMIEDLSTADVRENVKGEWIPIEKGEKGYSAGDFRCSVCGQPNKCYSLTPYCCNCGADMRGDGDVD